MEDEQAEQGAEGDARGLPNTAPLSSWPGEGEPDDGPFLHAPNISTIILRPEDDFVLVGGKGIYGAMTEDQACGCVSTHLQREGGNAQKAAEALTATAASKSRESPNYVEKEFTAIVIALK